jgi:hypothetical protein
MENGLNVNPTLQTLRRIGQALSRRLIVDFAAPTSSTYHRLGTIRVIGDWDGDRLTAVMTRHLSQKKRWLSPFY